MNGGGQTRTGELRRGEIYSLLQLPLCDTPIKKMVEMLTVGIEPTTARLQVECSTN